MNITPTRSYRCAYHPVDAFGNAQVSESGVLPTVQLRAPSAEHARRVAHVVTGCAIESVERIEDEVAA